MRAFVCVLVGLCFIAATSGYHDGRPCYYNTYCLSGRCVRGRCASGDDTEPMGDARRKFRPRSANVGQSCRGWNHCKMGLRCMNSKCRKGDDTQPMEDAARPRSRKVGWRCLETYQCELGLKCMDQKCQKAWWHLAHVGWSNRPKLMVDGTWSVCALCIELCVW